MSRAGLGAAFPQQRNGLQRRRNNPWAAMASIFHIRHINSASVSFFFFFYQLMVTHDGEEGHWHTVKA